MLDLQQTVATDVSQGALPVYPSLDKTMETSLVLNEKGHVWLLHNQPFPSVLNWAEYDARQKSLSFISYEGKIIDMGITIHKPFHARLMKLNQIATILLHEGKICDFYIIPLISRQA
jgi:hypothetical protein